MLFDIFIIFLLVLLNGFLAMSEMAVVSARKARLTLKAEAGNKSAVIALRLANDSATFLASIQIGITLIGILSGAYSGATLAEPLGNYFKNLGFGIESDEAALFIVVIAVTYLSLTIGELVPKHLALAYAEPIACLVARPITLLIQFTRPLVFVLNLSNRLLLRLFGAREETKNEVTEEEVKAIIAEGQHSGALDIGEREILERIIRLDDFDISAVMTHRQDIVWIDVEESVESVLEKVERTRHSRYLVCEGSIDRPLGLVVVKDMLLSLGRQKPFDPRTRMRKPMYVPDDASILRVLEEFKQSTSSFAVLVNDHGGLQGIVTLKDMLEAVIGHLPEPAHREDYGATQRDDGSWLVDGGLSILETEALLGVHIITEDESINTIAGFVFSQYGRLPKAGDHLTWRNLRFEVVDMDRARIDKLLIMILPK